MLGTSFNGLVELTKKNVFEKNWFQETCRVDFQILYEIKNINN